MNLDRSSSSSSLISGSEEIKISSIDHQKSSRFNTRVSSKKAKSKRIITGTRKSVTKKSLRIRKYKSRHPVNNKPGTTSKGYLIENPSQVLRLK